VIKRIIEVSSEAAHLAVRDGQLLLKREGEVIRQVPVEDVGILICDHPGITYTHGALNALLANNAAVVICGPNHLPTGLLLPLEANTLQGERFRHQSEAALPVKKRLWQGLVKAKVSNQAWALAQVGENAEPVREMARRVRSGDGGNHEAQAARRYWPKLMGKAFRRSREGAAPNNLLNYGYMVLRAAVARSLCGAGLHPSFGVAHRNRYNAYPLADDVMEPFRPLVDLAARRLYLDGVEVLDREAKAELLGVLSTEVVLDGDRGPLMVGLHRTAASLYRVFAGEEKCLTLPAL